ncbi:MAG: magnesium-dependent phosphatase-1 [Armatimonadota bacterium]|nr:magnesium-dependent phosphatase-1 [Armatimonadota bacterium]MDR7423376.1 magnesium-dependent phosphatase-1 [Armatimonadota bacterium]MDR7454662.1 magnesium-dependent phosphatase-1 [Armatimonadota bacterium]MDR7456582.1 magnesium-dependent phosphatase-1 [Armatimonadota bacterium]MDR7497369.1 magnesium-dependent phosphatase-1 [Armatimonadota bacterium]
MAVRLVILDCDLTLWNHPNVTALARPLRRVATDAVEDQAGVRVTLFPGVHRTLEGLRQRGLIVACASWNEPEPVEEIFTLLDLGRYFDHRKVEPHPHKDRTIRALLDELRGRGTALEPDQVLYVDDRRLHLEAVRAAVGGIRFLQYGVDIRALDELLSYLDSRGPAAQAQA